MRSFCRTTRQFASPWLRQKPNRCFPFAFGLLQIISSVPNKSLWFWHVLFIMTIFNFNEFWSLRTIARIKKLNVTVNKLPRSQDINITKLPTTLWSFLKHIFPWKFELRGGQEVINKTCKSMAHWLQDTNFFPWHTKWCNAWCMIYLFFIYFDNFDKPNYLVVF